MSKLSEAGSSKSSTIRSWLLKDDGILVSILSPFIKIEIVAPLVGPTFTASRAPNVVLVVLSSRGFCFFDFQLAVRVDPTLASFHGIGNQQRLSAMSTEPPSFCFCFFDLLLALHVNPTFTLFYPTGVSKNLIAMNTMIHGTR